MVGEGNGFSEVLPRFCRAGGGLQVADSRRPCRARRHPAIHPVFIDRWSLPNLQGTCQYVPTNHSPPSNSAIPGKYKLSGFFATPNFAYVATRLYSRVISR